MEELRECPFCGGEANIDEMSQDYYMVCCSKCGISCEFGTYLTAIEMWNRRFSQNK
jgi:Lar family restriction alleviation protein